MTGSAESRGAVVGFSSRDPGTVRCEGVRGQC